MSKASKNVQDGMEFLKDTMSAATPSVTSTTYTTRTWSRKRDDGSYETTTETTKDFTIKPSKTGAKFGAIAGAAAGGVIGNYLPFIGGPVCAAIGAIAGGIAGWIFGPA